MWHTTSSCRYYRFMVFIEPKGTGTILQIYTDHIFWSVYQCVVIANQRLVHSLYITQYCFQTDTQMKRNKIWYKVLSWTYVSSFCTRYRYPTKW
jgi:hypothetical protein